MNVFPCCRAVRPSGSTGFRTPVVVSHQEAPKTSDAQSDENTGHAHIGYFQERAPLPLDRDSAQDEPASQASEEHKTSVPDQGNLPGSLQKTIFVNHHVEEARPENAAQKGPEGHIADKPWLETPTAREGHRPA